MILGINGPVELPNDSIVLMFESFLFDKSRNRKGLQSARITLENRWAILQSPGEWMDNLVGSVDGFEYEIKNLIQDKPVVICLHSNDILLNSKEMMNRLKAIKDVHIILSISVPDTITNEIQGTEYLVSHIHYGFGSGFFGILGPLVIDATTPSSRINMYLEAQKRTGDVLLICELKDSADRLTNFNYSRTVFIGSHIPSHLIQCALPGSHVTGEKVVLSTGVRYKTDMKKFGGVGIDLKALKETYPSHWDSAHALARSLLDFNWEPPKLTIKYDDSPKWVCHICGLVAKLDEKENYTKHGFTYCSIGCLSEHRRKNFQP